MNTKVHPLLRFALISALTDSRVNSLLAFSIASVMTSTVIARPFSSTRRMHPDGVKEWRGASRRVIRKRQLGHDRQRHVLIIERSVPVSGHVRTRRTESD